MQPWKHGRSEHPAPDSLSARQPSGAPFGLCRPWHSRPNTGRSARWHCSSLDLQRSIMFDPTKLLYGWNEGRWKNSGKFQVSCDVCQQQNAKQWRRNPAAPKSVQSNGCKTKHVPNPNALFCHFRKQCPCGLLWLVDAFEVFTLTHHRTQLLAM